MYVYALFTQTIILDRLLRYKGSLFFGFFYLLQGVPVVVNAFIISLLSRN